MHLGKVRPRSSKAEMLLFVPVHTTIQAHSHRDDRMATVVSGNWQLAYGTHFNEAALKSPPSGSVYSEPEGANHFARTTDQPGTVHICGFGPTDTHYFRCCERSRFASEEMILLSAANMDARFEDGSDLYPTLPR